MNFQFSKSVPERVPQYVALFQRAFPGNTKLSSKYLQWLYRDNPDGALVGFDAFHGQKLVGHYACVPRQYVGAEGPKRCLHSVNTATDPEFTRRGLFTRLAEMTYEAATRAGFQFVFGVANKNSISGFTSKLGFDSLGNVRLGLMGSLDVGAQAGSFTTSKKWTQWRLKNPSRKYCCVPASQTKAKIYCRSSLAAIILGEIDQIDIPLYRLEVPKFTTPLRLAPTYPCTSAIKVPNGLMPSPWHVIARPLSDSCYPNIKLSGLDLDSF